MNFCHLKNLELEPHYQKYNWKGRTPRWHCCKGWFSFVCIVYRPRIISISNDSSKSHGYHLQNGQGAQNKQLMQYPLKLRSKWKMLHRYEIIRCHNAKIFEYVHWSTNFPNHGPAWKTQSFLLKGICTVTLWQDHWKGNFEKVLLEHGWEKVLNWECLFVNRARGLFLSVHVDDIKLAEQTENRNRFGKFSWRTLIWENQHHFLTMCIWVALKDNAK